MPTESAPFWCWNKQCRLYKKCHAGECEVPETDRTPAAGLLMDEIKAIQARISASMARYALPFGGITSWLPSHVECSPDGGQTWMDCNVPNCPYPTRLKPGQGHP